MTDFTKENWIDRFEQKKWYRIVKLILPGLALIGLAYAIYDNWDSNRTSQRIVEQISTQYVGNFPLQMDKITLRIQEAEKQITIAVDQPAYGSFSSPNEFKNYYDKLWSKWNTEEFANFNQLKLICYDEEKRRMEMYKQFDVPDSLELDTAYFLEYVPRGSKNNKRFKAKLENFNPQNKHNIYTFSDLFDRIEAKNKEMLSQLEDKLGDRFDLTELSKEQEPLPLYFWMFDNDNSAFLSFRSYGPLTTEVTISTSDPSILAYLKSIENDIIEEQKRKHNKTYEQ